MSTEPLLIPKDQYDYIVDRIAVPDSPVGIDAQYTHAIVIEYLRRISARLDAIEAELNIRSEAAK